MCTMLTRKWTAPRTRLLIITIAKDKKKKRNRGPTMIYSVEQDGSWSIEFEPTWYDIGWSSLLLPYLFEYNSNYSVLTYYVMTYFSYRVSPRILIYWWLSSQIYCTVWIVDRDHLVSLVTIKCSFSCLHFSQKSVDNLYVSLTNLHL